MADISPPDKKAQNFGLVSAAFGIGFVLGPIIGGLLGQFGPRMPFIVAMCLAGLNFGLAYFFLPETLTDGNRRAFDWRRANPVGAFKAIGSLPGLRPLMAIYFFDQIAFFVYPAVWSYFTKARFEWGTDMVGYSLAAFGVGMAIVQGLLIRIVIPKIGEENTLYVGLVINLIAFAAMAVVPWGWLVIALTPLTALGAMAPPALMGMASKIAGKDQQGELQGLFTSIASIGMMLSTLIMTQVFWFFTRDAAPMHAPSAPFVVSFALMAVCIFIYATHRVKSTNP
jgi:DHA1 family tetracycline resistance protein-like MFS transporter